MSLLSQKEQEAVEEVLGKPVYLGLDPTDEKIKFRLLIFSFISLMVVGFELTFGPESAFLGLKIQGINHTVIFLGLSLINLYLFVHYVWRILDRLDEYRLRSTGTKLSFVTTAKIASSHGDYPNDPRQSTLYTWWIEEVKRFDSIKTFIGEIENKIEKGNIHIEEMKSMESPPKNIHVIVEQLSQANQSLQQLKSVFEKLQKKFDDGRIPVSLERFNTFYGRFLKSQNLRWLFLDFLLPIGTGAAAVIVVIYKFIEHTWL